MPTDEGRRRQVEAEQYKQAAEAERERQEREAAEKLERAKRFGYWTPPNQPKSER